MTTDVYDVVPSGQIFAIATKESKRDLNWLLSQDSYQGLTDDEIKEIIEYKTEQTRKDEEIKAMRKEYEETTSAAAAASATMVEDSRKVLETLLATSTSYDSVAAEKTTNKLFKPEVI
nr:MAG TPA: hypothetical protein [Bacteriophage sp.]